MPRWPVVRTENRGVNPLLQLGHPKWAANAGQGSHASDHEVAEVEKSSDYYRRTSRGQAEGLIGLGLISDCAPVQVSWTLGALPRGRT